VSAGPEGTRRSSVSAGPEGTRRAAVGAGARALFLAPAAARVPGRVFLPQVPAAGAPPPKLTPLSSLSPRPRQDPRGNSACTTSFAPEASSLHAPHPNQKEKEKKKKEKKRKEKAEEAAEAAAAARRRGRAQRPEAAAAGTRGRGFVQAGRGAPMAECGRGAAGGALPTSPSPALGAKGALKAGAGEGGGGGGGGRLGHGRARYDSGGVSNGDCSLGVSGDEARTSPGRGPLGVALARTPSPAAGPVPRDSKPGGLPRRSSIIKVSRRPARVLGLAFPAPEKLWRKEAMQNEPTAKGKPGCRGVWSAGAGIGKLMALGKNGEVI
jgi:hypothetical protein